MLKEDLTTLPIFQGCLTNSKITILLAWSRLLLMHMLQGLLKGLFPDSQVGGCLLGKACYESGYNHTCLKKIC
jgi:hypothetical protein